MLFKKFSKKTKLEFEDSKISIEKSVEKKYHKLSKSLFQKSFILKEKINEKNYSIIQLNKSTSN